MSLINTTSELDELCNHLSNADFVIYVTAQTVGSCPSEAGSGTLAFASSCRADQYDRPTFGYVNFW